MTDAAGDGFVLWAQPIDRMSPDVIRLFQSTYLDPQDHAVRRSQWFAYISAQTSGAEREQLEGGSWVAKMDKGSVGEIPASDRTNPDALPVVTVMVNRKNAGNSALLTVLNSFADRVGYDLDPKLTDVFAAALLARAKPSLFERWRP